jgi:hypothetical protein
MAKNMNFKLTIDDSSLEELELKAFEYLWYTSEALHTDLMLSQTMPRDSGHMQNRATRVQKVDKDEYQLLTDTPYAKWVYFNPEGKRIHTDKNPSARDHWLETYVSGDKKDYIYETFLKFAKMGR